MPRKLSPITIRPVSGGRLVTSSAEEPGSLNYRVKTNWRRFIDSEIMREGDLYFQPDMVAVLGAQSLNAPTDVVGMWELDRPNGERAIIAATRTTLYRFVFNTLSWSTIGSGFSSAAKYWQAESIDGYLILNNGVDLPVTYRVEDSAVSPIYEMREIGISAVAAICVYNGFLICADITEIQANQLVTWMNGGTPYGVVPTNITNRIRYKIVWSDYGEPRNWAPVIQGVIETGTRSTVTLVYPVSAFPVGSKLAVINAGPSGGTLGGQTNTPDGEPVTAVSGAVLTLADPSVTSLPYPVTVQVTRFADTSTFVGSSSIQDDSSAIIRMKPLKGLLYIYRESSIFSGRYTASVETPFVFRREYAGRNVPFYPAAIEEVESNAHVYPTENRFYYFDGVGEPRLMRALDDASDLFYPTLDGTNTEKVFSSYNAITQEVFFFSPTGVLAYDCEQKTASFIDETYTAAAYVRKPTASVNTGPAENWFLLAKSGAVLRYGLSNQTAPVYTRRGSTYTATIKSGLGPVNSEFSEKDMLGYVPLLAAGSSLPDITVKVYGCDNLSRTPDLLFTTTVTEPDVQNLIPTFFQNIYFQDEISVVSGTQTELSGRLWHFVSLETESVTRG